MNLNAGISPPLDAEPGAAPAVAVMVCGSALLTLGMAISFLIPGSSTQLASIDFDTAAFLAFQVEHVPVTNLVFGHP